MHKQDGAGQARSGFNVNFEWDVPLYEGYRYSFVNNLSGKPSTSSFFGIRISGIKDIFEQYKPEKVIVQGWFPFAFLQVIYFCRRKGIELLVRGDSNLLMKTGFIRKQLKFLMMTFLLPRFDKILTVGSHNADFYKYYGISEQKLFFAPHCIDTGFFKDQFNSFEREPSDKVRIGFAGKFIDKKRPIDLLKAVRNSVHKDDIILVFIGDGPLKESLIKYAEENGLNIDFKGFLNQSQIVEKGYCHIDVLVLPSAFNETWGLVVNEVMTGGIPAIVSSKVGCAPDLIDEGKTGYVFEAGNIKDLTDKIDAYIQKYKTDFDFRDQVIRRIDKFSTDKTVEGFVKALNTQRN